MAAAVDQAVGRRPIVNWTLYAWISEMQSDVSENKSANFPFHIFLQEETSFWCPFSALGSLSLFPTQDCWSDAGLEANGFSDHSPSSLSNNHYIPRAWHCYQQQGRESKGETAAFYFWAEHGFKKYTQCQYSIFGGSFCFLSALLLPYLKNYCLPWDIGHLQNIHVSFSPLKVVGLIFGTAHGMELIKALSAVLPKRSKSSTLSPNTQEVQCCWDAQQALASYSNAGMGVMCLVLFSGRPLSSPI